MESDKICPTLAPSKAASGTTRNTGLAPARSPGCAAGEAAGSRSGDLGEGLHAEKVTNQRTNPDDNHSDNQGHCQDYPGYHCQRDCQSLDQSSLSYATQSPLESPLNQPSSSSSHDLIQSGVSKTAKVLELLEQKLPPYIANCFKSSGFDEIDVISEMDISDKPGNSIEIIEKFIQKKFAASPDHNCFPAAMPFEFPPGHKLRICNFVKEVRKLKRSYDSADMKPILKRTNKSASNEQACKVPRIDPDFQEPNVLSVADIYKQVRACLRKWMREQEDDCRNLRESEDFTLNVDSNRRSGKVNVSIRCLLCGTQTTLHQIKNTYICSNFYRHITPCVKKRNTEDEPKTRYRQHSRQPALNEYFSKSNATQGNGTSNVVPDDEVSHQHFVDLTSSGHRSSDDVASEHSAAESGSPLEQVF